MSEMVERVARALWVHDGGTAEDFDELLSAQQGGATVLQVVEYCEAAGAAIEAMRRPTKEMIIEGNYKIDECIDFRNYDSGAGYSVGSSAAVDALNAMIDAALK